MRLLFIHISRGHRRPLLWPACIPQQTLYQLSSAVLLQTETGARFTRSMYDFLPKQLSFLSAWINSLRWCFEMWGNCTFPRPEWSATTVWPQGTSGAAATGSGFLRSIQSLLLDLSVLHQKRPLFKQTTWDNEAHALLFVMQVGWSSVKQYHTYTWALVPEGYTEGSDVNCCALFQGRNIKECNNSSLYFNS